MFGTREGGVHGSLRLQVAAAFGRNGTEATWDILIGPEGTYNAAWPHWRRVKKPGMELDEHFLRIPQINVTDSSDSKMIPSITDSNCPELDSFANGPGNPGDGPSKNLHDQKTWKCGGPAGQRFQQSTPCRTWCSPPTHRNLAIFVGLQCPWSNSQNSPL